MEKKLDILDKIKDYSLERTFEEQEKILDYQKKALELLEKVFDNQLVDKNQVLSSKEMKLDLAKLGYFLEKNESIEDLKELKENEQEIDNILEGMSDKLELNFEKEKDIVLLNENLIEQELVAQSKLDGNTKEKVLDGAFQNENGQIASSLVVDANKEKIKETVSALNDRLNPINKYPAPKFNSKKSSNKDEKRKKFEETYINNFIQKQSRGLVLDTETFSHTNTILEPGMVMVNIKGIRDKSLNLNEERPNAVIGNSGLITERRRVI
jgi:hypothetical protein